MIKNYRGINCTFRTNYKTTKNLTISETISIRSKVIFMRYLPHLFIKRHFPTNHLWKPETPNIEETSLMS